MAVNAAASPASTNEITTAGPAYCAAAVPVVTKMPAPTTLAMPSVVRLNAPIATAVEPLAVLLRLDQDRLEPVGHARSLTETATRKALLRRNGAVGEARLRLTGARPAARQAGASAGRHGPGVRLRPATTRSPRCASGSTHSGTGPGRRAGDADPPPRRARLRRPEGSDGDSCSCVFLHDAARARPRPRRLDRRRGHGHAHRQGRAVAPGAATGAC